LTAPTVLVTGGAKRIGRAICEHFAGQGWHVVIHYHASRAEAEALAAALPLASTCGFDLADHAALPGTVASLAQRHPDWRALVCSGSRFEPDRPEAPDMALWQSVHSANLAGNVLLAAHYLGHANSAQGRCIVNLLDQKLANLNPDFFAYTVAKAGLKTAGEMLALARFGSADRIYGLAPGLTLPSHDQTETEFARSGAMNLLHRFTDTAEIAAAAWFLVTGPVASGTTLYVDSGQRLIPQPRDVMYAVREVVA
jgi:NAD(P)-dependent dehydrogenase (short-subunit alcohol dehydrogenase family)